MSDQKSGFIEKLAKQYEDNRETIPNLGSMNYEQFEGFVEKHSYSKLNSFKKKYLKADGVQLQVLNSKQDKRIREEFYLSSFCKVDRVETGDVRDETACVDATKEKNRIVKRPNGVKVYFLKEKISVYWWCKTPADALRWYNVVNNNVEICIREAVDNLVTVHQREMGGKTTGRIKQFLLLREVASDEEYDVHSMKKPFNILSRKIEQGDDDFEEDLSKHLKEEFDIDFSNSSSKNTLLIKATLHNFISGVVSLLDVGCNPDLRNNNGDTALLIASRLGHFDIALALLKRNANVDIKNIEGETALGEATRFQQADIIPMLAQPSVVFTMEAVGGKKPKKTEAPKRKSSKSRKSEISVPELVIASDDDPSNKKIDKFKKIDESLKDLMSEVSGDKLEDPDEAVKSESESSDVGSSVKSFGVVSPAVLSDRESEGVTESVSEEFSESSSSEEEDEDSEDEKKTVIDPLTPKSLQNEVESLLFAQNDKPEPAEDMTPEAESKEVEKPKPVIVVKKRVAEVPIVQQGQASKKKARRSSSMGNLLDSKRSLISERASSFKEVSKKPLMDEPPEPPKKKPQRERAPPPKTRWSLKDE